MEKFTSFSLSMARLRIFALLICFLLLPRTARSAEQGAFASDPSKVSEETLRHFNSLYGTAEQHALQSSGREQAKFAAQLLEAVKDLKDDKDLCAYLLEKAYQFGLKDPAGYATAGDALKKMREAQADAEPALAGKSAELHRLEYKHDTGARRTEAGRLLVDSLMAEGQGLMRSGRFSEASKRFSEALTMASAVHSSRADEINGSIRAVRARTKVKEKLDRLLEKLREKPEAFVAEEAARIYISGLDMPGEVAHVTGIDTGGETARLAGLAAADPQSLPEADCMQLGQWYLAMAGSGADENSKLIVLDRARIYYGRFLDLHEKKDSDRLKVTTDLAKVEKQLDPADPRSRTADRIVIWNTHNAGSKDRGATMLNIILLNKRTPVWSKNDVPIAWSGDKDVSLELDVPKIVFDVVRIEVTACHGTSAGLSEVQVIRGRNNVAAHANVRSSNEWTGHFPASALTDGVVTPVAGSPGYWLALVPTAWVEIDLKSANVNNSDKNGVN